MALADAELVIRTALDAEFTSARVVTETPSNLGDVLPCIQVTRFGGADDVLVLDAAHIDIDTYAATRQAAADLAEQVRTYLRLTLPGTSHGGGFVADVTTISAPTWTPYDNTTLRRFTASYRIAIRSIP